MKKTILLGLLVTGFLTSCNKDDDKEDFDGTEDAIREFVTPDLYTTMTGMGMQINSGDTPPEISGLYFVEPVLEASNRPSDIIGNSYEDYYVTFENQDNDDLTVDFSYVGDTEEGVGNNSLISGSGDAFTAILKTVSSTGSDTAESIIVVSGTVSQEGIVNYQFAVFMLDNHDSELFIENGQGRIFRDSDEFAPRTSLTGLRATLATGNFTSMLRK